MPAEPTTARTRCCIVGGGPAGMMLGYLLARAGVETTVLEKRADFLRDFRGDTVHPSTMRIMDELASSIEVSRAQVLEATSLLAPHIRDVGSWDDVKLLTVCVDRLTRWSGAGVLCIGDAAHAMSPIGGVGINLAIQDAVAAANRLAVKLRDGRVAERSEAGGGVVQPEDLEHPPRACLQRGIGVERIRALELAVLGCEGAVTTGLAVRDVGCLRTAVVRRGAAVHRAAVREGLLGDADRATASDVQSPRLNVEFTERAWSDETPRARPNAVVHHSINSWIRRLRKSNTASKSRPTSQPAAKSPSAPSGRR